MTRPTECTREEVLAAVRKGRGKTSLVAHILGVTGETVRNYADRWKTVADAIKAERTSFDITLVDKAEVKLEEAVMEGKAWAVKYALDRKGDERGYTPREKQEHSGNVATTIEVVYVNEDTPDATEPPSGTADGGGPGAAI